MFSDLGRCSITPHSFRASLHRLAALPLPVVQKRKRTLARHLSFPSVAENRTWVPPPFLLAAHLVCLSLPPAVRLRQPEWSPSIANVLEPLPSSRRAVPAQRVIGRAAFQWALVPSAVPSCLAWRMLQRSPTGPSRSGLAIAALVAGKAGLQIAQNGSQIRLAGDVLLSLDSPSKLFHLNRPLCIAPHQPGPLGATAHCQTLAQLGLRVCPYLRRSWCAPCAGEPRG